MHKMGINRKAWNTCVFRIGVPPGISLHLSIMLKMARKATKVIPSARCSVLPKPRMHNLLLIMVAVLLPAIGLPQSKTGFEVKKVVIDAGHGGKDPGALGTGRYKKTESDLALDVALKVREYIQKYYNNVEIVMTRETDVFLELRERTRIANKAKADLFISIHCNTNGNTKAFGSETYVIGLHKSESNLETAKRENQVIFLEDNYEENYEGFDPSSPESMIALSMMQSQYLESSIYFADLVQDQFRERVHRRDRGVKQAGYWVISQTVMPSVLIELGFISNHSEEDFLNSEQGQVYLASAIYRAFKEYKTTVEGVDTSLSPVEQSNEENDRAEKQEESQDTSDAEEKKPAEAFATSALPVFSVQLTASQDQVQTVPENFKGINGVIERKEGEIYKYSVGSVTEFESAVEIQREVRDKGYKDAFIIAMYNGKRISLQEAFEIIKKQG